MNAQNPERRRRLPGHRPRIGLLPVRGDMIHPTANTTFVSGQPHEGSIGRLRRWSHMPLDHFAAWRPAYGAQLPALCGPVARESPEAEASARGGDLQFWTLTKYQPPPPPPEDGSRRPYRPGVASRDQRHIHYLPVDKLHPVILRQQAGIAITWYSSTVKQCPTTSAGNTYFTPLRTARITG